MNQFYQKHRIKLWLAQGAGLLLIGFLFAWLVLPNGNPSPEPAGGAAATEISDAKPTIWTCSMHPQIRRDGPGKCPICGMDLVPVRESAGGVRTVSIGADIAKLMNVQTSPVERRYVTAEVPMVGKVEYDETRLAHITAWVSGRLERLFVDYTGVEVNEGDHMVQIYSEQLYTAQEELLSALNRQTERTTSRFVEPVNLLESAREKLRRLGLTPQQIEEIEQRGTASETIIIYSPASGVVVQKLKQEGDRVQTGDRIYTVADLSHLWVKLDAYESDLAWLRYGQDVEFTTEAYPGDVFHGRIAFIDPVLNEATRTVKVRVNVENDDGRLKPEMFVRAMVKSQIAGGGRVLDASLAGKWISPMHPEIVKDEPGECDICGMPLVRAESMGYVTAEPSDSEKPLVVPASAVLLTGKRAIVYVQIPDAEKPTYEGREIVIGPRAGDYYLVKAGLQEGDLVVTNGNFKLDSALQIAAKPSMMTPQGGGGGGHDHGNMQAQSVDASMEMDGHPMELVPKVRSTMLQVLEIFASIQKAIERANLAEIREGYRELAVAIKEVPADLIGPEMRPHWLEAAMLLRNDAVEGQEVNSMQEADRVFALTRTHIVQLQGQFPLSAEGDDEPPSVPDFEVPTVVSQQIEQLLPAYLRIGESLAADDEASARTAIAALHEQTESFPPLTPEGIAIELWREEKRDLAEIVARLVKSNDLETIRTAFALLSEEMLSLHSMFGLPATNLYRVHCPMAFDGRGAWWLQTSDAVRNPYYGASMLKCADKVEALEPKGGSEGDKE